MQGWLAVMSAGAVLAGVICTLLRKGPHGALWFVLVVLDLHWIIESVAAYQPAHLPSG